MRTTRVWVAAAMLALPLAVTSAAPAHACAGNKVCDTVNWVCDQVAGPCIP
jgi:hypothetical protein